MYLYYMFITSVVKLHENERRCNMEAKLVTEMSRGYLQLIVLELLDEPIHGYGLLKKLREIGYDSVEANTLYPLLCRFEKNDWAQSQWLLTEGQPQKQYKITETGNEIRRQLNYLWEQQCEVMKKVKGRLDD